MSRLRGVASGAVALALPAVALPLGVAFAPTPVAMLSLVSVGAVIALRALGGRTTLWMLFVATIPLREPLSFDIVGTKTIYFNDLLLLPMLAITLYENGIGTIWRRSPGLRLGLAILGVGILGAYMATSWASALDQLHRLVMQTAAFVVTWHWVRSGQRARQICIALLLGLLPAVFVGLGQSSLSVEQIQQATGWKPPVAWSPEGRPMVRSFSTYGHTLTYSHALTIGVGLSLGLLLRERTAVRRLLFAGFAAVFLYANQFTYSLGGLVGTAATVGVAALLWNRRWALTAIPIVALAWLAMAPTTFVHRVNQIFHGEHTSLMARFVTYQSALDLVADHPVIGVGWGGVGSAMTGEYRRVRTHGIQDLMAAENYFLQRAVASGLVGVALSVGLCIWFFRAAMSRRRPPEEPAGSEWPRKAVLIAGAAFWIQAQTQPTADHPNNYVFFILLAIAERMRMAYRSES